MLTLAAWKLGGGGGVGTKKVGEYEPGVWAQTKTRTLHCSHFAARNLTADENTVLLSCCIWHKKKRKHCIAVMLQHGSLNHWCENTALLSCCSTEIWTIDAKTLNCYHVAVRKFGWMRLGMCVCVCLLQIHWRSKDSSYGQQVTQYHWPMCCQAAGSAETVDVSRHRQQTSVCTHYLLHLKTSSATYSNHCVWSGSYIQLSWLAPPAPWSDSWSERDHSKGIHE
jgi:hypothetical protein